MRPQPIRLPTRAALEAVGFVAVAIRAGWAAAALLINLPAETSIAGAWIRAPWGTEVIGETGAGRAAMILETDRTAGSATRELTGQETAFETTIPAAGRTMTGTPPPPSRGSWQLTAVSAG